MKYLGGKQRLGKHIAIVLKDLWEQTNGLTHYIEPFCGSLGVLKNMTDLSVPVVANDYHQDLIQMWCEVRDKTLVYPDHVSEEEYNKAKQIPSPSALKSFIGFGLSFGGRYFGAFAPKYVNGKKEDFCKEMKTSLTRISPQIQKVTFTNQMYQDMNPVHSFIYCDPPYRQVKFPIRYRREVKHYDKFDSDLFWETMRKWSEHNFVVISELSAPDDFIEIWNLNRYRSACQSTKTRFKDPTITTHRVEKLFVYSKFKNAHCKMIRPYGADSNVVF